MSIYTDVSIRVGVRDRRAAVIASTGSAGRDGDCYAERVVTLSEVAAIVSDLAEHNRDMDDAEIEQRTLQQVFDRYFDR